MRIQAKEKSVFAFLSIKIQVILLMTENTKRTFRCKLDEARDAGIHPSKGKLEEERDPENEATRSRRRTFLPSVAFCDAGRGSVNGGATGFRKSEAMFLIVCYLFCRHHN